MQQSPTLVRSNDTTSLPSFLSERVDQYYEQRVRKTWGGGHILKGQHPDNGSILINHNDYLGVIGRPAIVNAQLDSLKAQSSDVMMSGVFQHGDNPQQALEQRLARFTGKQGALLSQSGYAANVGLLQSIAGPETPVYIDMRAHASLWEGINSANAVARPFPHNNHRKLATLIERHGPGIIVVDSVYSTIGSVCPLLEFVEVAEVHGCVLVVDESHSLGTHGPQGAGLVAELGLTDRVPFITASLAKAFAGRAGVVLGDARVIEYLKYEAWPSIFSSALFPVDLAGLAATLEFIHSADLERQRLHRHALALKTGLQALGYNVEDSHSQIISLEPGREQDTMVLRDALESRGVFGAVFCAPATPKNRSIIRFSVSANLKSEQLDRVLEVCETVRGEVGMADWPSTRRLARTLLEQAA